MPLNKSYLAPIVRYLNNPSDPKLKAEIDEFRAQSAENESYFKNIEQNWLLSAKAKPLDAVRENEAVARLKKALKGNVRTMNPAWVWMRNIAATLLLAVMGYWLYNISTAPVWLTKSTLANQTDSVKLSDGSMIVLAPGSQIRYPQKFESDQPRNVFFSKGQAFFSITKDARHPFKVSINQSNVTVLGTSFNIQLLATGIDLSVKTGKVKFLPYQGGNASVLTAGQALNYNISNKQYTTKIFLNADAWLTHRLVFEDTPLDVVCEQLTDYYKTPIKLQNHHKTIKKLNATFTNNTLNEVLEILSETYDIEVNKQPHQINLITR